MISSLCITFGCFSVKMVWYSTRHCEHAELFLAEESFADAASLYKRYLGFYVHMASSSHNRNDSRACTRALGSSGPLHRDSTRIMACATPSSVWYTRSPPCKPCLGWSLSQLVVSGRKVKLLQLCTPLSRVAQSLQNCGRHNFLVRS